MSGYVGCGKDTFGQHVQDSDAFEFALDQITNGTPEEQDEFVEWFFSGNWYYENDDDLEEE